MIRIEVSSPALHDYEETQDLEMAARAATLLFKLACPNIKGRCTRKRKPDELSYFILAGVKCAPYFKVTA